MSDQDLVLDTIQEAQRLPLNDCIRSTPDETIIMLRFLPDRRDVMAAINLLRSRSGLRVVK